MPVIQNKKKLERYHGNYKSFKLCIMALEDALKSVDPGKLIANSIKFDNKILYIKDVHTDTHKFDLSEYETFHIVGAGKATARMAKTFMEISKDYIQFTSGAVNIPYNEKIKPEKIIVTEASHPIPDNNSIKGTRKIMDLLKNIRTRSLIFVLISGGASSLLCNPIKGLELSDKQEITKLLLKSGASIHEINVIRKHMSRIKGGKLPTYTKSISTFVTIILSDVVGDDLKIIGSGPTVWDDSSESDAINILKKYKIWDIKNNPHSLKITKIFENRNQRYNNSRWVLNTFNRVHNILIGNNKIACQSAVTCLEKNGVKTQYLGSDVTIQAKNFGRQLVNLTIKKPRNEIPFAFVIGGETVVNIKSNKKYHQKHGIGGRNQEAILSAIYNLRDNSDLKDFTILCCGTDGIDGNSKFAGGIVTPMTIHNIKKEDFAIKRYLDLHDSTTVLEKINSQIITGRTGTNVNDISIICRIK